MRVGLYQPKLFSQVGDKVRSCIPCKILVGKLKVVALALITVLVQAPFLQSELQFISEIIIASSNQHRWILISTDYFTKCVEEIPIKNATDTIVIKFIEDKILSRFVCPQQIVTDNAQAFNSFKMIEFCQKYQITLHHSTHYYPQGNGLA